MEITNFIIAIIAILISSITAYWQFFRKPKLSVFYKDEEPFRKLLLPYDGPNSYEAEWFLRLKVQNERRILAKNCFGKIIEWYTKGEKVLEFDPIKLHWVSNTPDDYSSINLSYKEYDYLDLVFTQRLRNKISLYTNTHLRGISTEFDLKENHAFKVVVYSENEASNVKVFKLWFQDDDPEGKLRFIRMKEINEKELTKNLRHT